jgi:hypothetical protein
MHVYNRGLKEISVSTPNNGPTPLVEHRRSQRILLALPIQISGQRINGAPFSERTKTILVNAHGALIRLRESVLAGQKLRMKNLGTNEELVCEVVDINAGREDLPEVGVAFSEPCPHFWRVSFPPKDWSLKSPEAKRHSGTSTSPEPAAVKK